MQPNEKVHTLYDEAQIKKGSDDVQPERLVAERDSTASLPKSKSRSLVPKILGALVLLALLAGAGFYATRYSVVQEQALDQLSSKLSDVESRIGSILTSISDQSGRSDASLKALSQTDAEINKALIEFRSDLNELKSTVGKNSSAIQSIETKLEASKLAAQQVRKVAAAKPVPKPLEVAPPIVDPKTIFPDFSLVSIDTFALQTFSVVRSPSRGLVDLGAADSIDGWRVVEVDVPGQRVAFESQTGVLRWLTAQP